MERVQDLIDKLYQQRQRNEGPLQLLPTVQQLYDALLTAAQKSSAAKSEKVAVVMPAKPRVQVRSQVEEGGRPAVIVPPASGPATSAPVVQPAPPAPQPAPVAEVPAPPAPEPTPAAALPAQPEPPAPKAPEPAPPAPPQQQAAPEKGPDFFQNSPLPQAAAPAPPPQPNPFGGHFDVGEEAPTLRPPEAKQPAPKEIHELISGPQESLNDKLKQERIEFAHVLKDTPIKDLRKAIGVNDKFLFVNELFRGDEAMYERSLKTINSFHIFPEAEYWINRELKVKLGWNEHSQTVKHFYNLVRRRFS